MSDPLEPIINAFAGLKAVGLDSLSNDSFNACPFPNRPNDRVAIDSDGAPVILVHSATKKHNAPPTELEYLAVRHGVVCEIIQPDSSVEQRTFSTVRFRGGSESLHHYFLRVVGAAVLGLPTEPTERDISLMVLRIAELFNALTQEPRQTAQGLWAEVFVIARATDIMEAVRNWRSSPDATYDFSDGYEHVEVKSVVGHSRSHHFSLEQLRPSDGGNVTVISFLLRQTDQNTTLEDLIGEVHRALESHHDVRLVFDRNIAVTLGRSAGSAMRVGFDADFAKANLRFFCSNAIPSINPSMPDEVSDVRFRVDLTDLDGEGSENLSGLARQLYII